MESRTYVAFWCKHCESVAHPTVWKYLGEIGDYYTTFTICPNCKKPSILREKSIMAYIRETFK